MSQPKRKTKKSLNSSISDISNSERLSDSIFNNHALAELKNVHVSDVIRSCRKQNIMNSAKKIRTATKAVQFKENKTTQCKENKVYNYSGITRVVEEKNVLIESQERQIQNLKMALERIRKDLDLSRVDYEKKKLQDLNMLRQQERENEENIKQLETLKEGLKNMKYKLDIKEIENAKLQRKNSQYLTENEELTVKITSLKEQFFNHSVDEKLLSDLKQELQILKEQAKMTKELEIHKAQLEERCRNFQKKVNEYIVKYNDIQSQYNQSQIRYYRAQKENDDLRLTIQDVQVENKNLKKLLEEEKNIMTEQTKKWHQRISKLEDRSRAERCITECMEAKANFSELGDRCQKLQVQNLLQEKLNQKDCKIQQLLSENQILLKDMQTRDKIFHELQQQQQITKSEQQYFQQTQAKKSTYIQELQNKCHLVLEQNKKINDKCTQLILRYEAEVKDFEQKIQQTCHNLNKQYCQNQQISANLQEAYLKLKEKQAKLKEMSDNLQAVEEKLSNSQQKLLKTEEKLSKTEHKLLQTQQKLQKTHQNLQQTNGKLQKTTRDFLDMNKKICAQTTQTQKQKIANTQMLATIEREKFQKQTLLQQLRFFEGEVKKYQDKICQTNSELKEIKFLVSSYSAEIKQLSDQLEEAQRNLQNEIYMKKQESCKFEEELGYFKGKYQEIFNQNIQLTEKLCLYQKQTIKNLTRVEQQKSQLQKALQQRIQLCDKTINKLIEENGQLKNKLGSLQIVKEGISFKLQDCEQIRRNMDQSICQLKDDKKELSIRYDALVKEMERREQNAKIAHRKIEEGNLNKYKEEQAILKEKYNAALNEAMEKDRQIQRYFQLLEGKDRQIERLQAIGKQIQNEELQKLKNYNVRLAQQVDQITAQFNRTFQQLQTVSFENASIRNKISNLESQVSSLRQKNMELTNEITSTHRNSQKQHEQYFYENNQLKTKITNLEERLQEQLQESSQWMHRFEEISKECRKIQNEYNKANRSYMDQSQRKNKENSREVQSYRAQIRVLQEENIQLQTVMDRELGKRKVMIEELLQEKKVLYEQLNRH